VCRDFDGPQNDERLQAKRSGPTDKLTVEEKSRKVEADLGPIKHYLAGRQGRRLLGYFILVVAPLLAPAAVLLLLTPARRED
jgi:hypothetical protein